MHPQCVVSKDKRFERVVKTKIKATVDEDANARNLEKKVIFFSDFEDSFWECLAVEHCT